MASTTHSGFVEYDFPKLILIILAPLSTAYLIPSAISLSYSSPLGTALIAIISTLLLMPLLPIEFPLIPPIIPDTCVP